MNRNSPRLKPYWLMVPLGLLYLSSLARLVELQIVRGPDEAKEVLAGMIHADEISAPRGRILDRQGRILAEDRPAWRLVLDSKKVHRSPYSLEQLAPLAEELQVKAVDLQEYCQSENDFSVVADELPSEVAHRLHFLITRELPGCGFALRPYWERVYPQGRVFAQLMGPLRAGFERGEAHSGLELAFDEILNGQNGSRLRQSVGRAFGIDPALELQPAQPGSDIVTTLDTRVGWIVREELERLAEERRPDWISAVVLDPRNGELIAMSSWPDFDPNDIRAEDRSHLAIRALTDPIEPGSTIKPFILGAALAKGVIGPDERFDGEQGLWHLRSRVIHDVVASGLITPRGILVRSSNIAASKVGLRMGAERLKRAFQNYAFDERLDITHGKAEEANSRLPSEYRWGQTIWTIPSVSFGHQLALTPARMAFSFAATFNGGQLYSPRLVQDAPLDEPRRVLPGSISEFLKEALTAVVEEGTGSKLPSWPDFRYGGKSGTTKKTHEAGRTTSFLAFGPVEEPSLLVSIVVENPRSGRYGRGISGPTAARILYRSLISLGRWQPVWEEDTLDSALAVGTR